MVRFFTAWLIRSVLAVLLLFGSEILLWTDPLSRLSLDWAILAAGYLALSAILLDLAVRYRVRDVFGLMVLAGIYGLLNGLLLNPQTALFDIPRTLITRVLGAHTLIGLLMLALFMAFNRSSRRVLLPGAVVTGLAWGIWVRWLPLLADTIAADVPLLTMLLVGLAGLLLITVLLALVRYDPVETANNLLLSSLGWVSAAGVLIALFIVRSNSIDSFALTIIILLIIFCGLLLWFQKREKGAALLDGRIPLQPSVSLFMMMSALFLITASLGYLLPLDFGGDQLTVYVALFTAFGVVWLPTVSLVSGVRAYRKLTRQRLL